NRLKEKPELTQMTHRKLVLELDKIKVLDFKAKTNPRLLNPLSKTARELLAALGTDVIDEVSV
ncbi:MAG: hypothetical protein IKX19_00625, partial [Clostridia bacterium]|nr:hypothetical protein [Clostridia bacterium]